MWTHSEDRGARMEEKRAWLSIPLFARPEGAFTYQQRMDILEKAYAQVDPQQPTVTSWLVVVAEAPQPDS